MTPHIQQANTAQPIAASTNARFATLDTTAITQTAAEIANDNYTSAPRPNILVKRRTRRARMAAR